jgi:hypothetical protein
MSNDIAALDMRIFENRITITVLAVLGRNAHKLLLNGVVAVNGMDNILDLNAVCPDILYGSSSNLTRDV